MFFFFLLLLQRLPDIKQWLECTSFEKKKKKQKTTQTLFKYFLPQKED